MGGSIVQQNSGRGGWGGGEKFESWVRAPEPVSKVFFQPSSTIIIYSHQRFRGSKRTRKLFRTVTLSEYIILCFGLLSFPQIVSSSLPTLASPLPSPPSIDPSIPSSCLLLLPKTHQRYICSTHRTKTPKSMIFSLRMPIHPLIHLCLSPSLSGLERISITSSSAAEAQELSSQVASPK